MKPRRSTGPAEAPLSRQEPFSHEAEKQLLACCLMDGTDALPRCIEARVSPESFHLLRHRVIYEVMLEVAEKNPPVSLEVLAEELRTRRRLEEVGGYAYLVEITQGIPTTAHLAYFISKVREKQMLRDLLQAASTTAEECYTYAGEGNGLPEFVDRVEQRIFKVTQERVANGTRPVKAAVEQAKNLIDRMINSKGALTGVPSGFRDLDRYTYGFQRQEMIVLAARPSIGKTSFALNIAEYAALPPAGIAPAPTLIFSLEMSSAALAMRLVCARARVNMKTLRDGFCSREQKQAIETASRELAAAPIFIDDSSALTIMELRAKARRIHAQTPLGFIIVDYLQLLSPTDATVQREQQVAECSRGLKALAKELDVPVLVLSQLNRSSEKENRTPRLSDLRESGAIEQDADVVLMLARPKEEPGEFQVAGDVADLLVAKQRNGPVGDLKLTFLRDITRFADYAAPR